MSYTVVKVMANAGALMHVERSEVFEGCKVRGSFREQVELTRQGRIKGLGKVGVRGVLSRREQDKQGWEWRPM